jgi:hypothetical protein
VVAFTSLAFAPRTPGAMLGTQPGGANSTVYHGEALGAVWAEPFTDCRDLTLEMIQPLSAAHCVFPTPSDRSHESTAASPSESSRVRTFTLSTMIPMDV